ncbi:RNA polymerase sigma factor SigF, partial [Streptomyces sp. NPDC004362]
MRPNDREGRVVATTTVQAVEQMVEVPQIADPSKVAPRDARELSRLFFEQLAVLEEGTPQYS